MPHLQNRNQKLKSLHSYSSEALVITVTCPQASNPQYEEQPPCKIHVVNKHQILKSTEIEFFMQINTQLEYKTQFILLFCVDMVLCPYLSDGFVDNGLMKGVFEAPECCCRVIKSKVIRRTGRL
jgi:hypothetical protein